MFVQTIQTVARVRHLGGNTHPPGDIGGEGETTQMPHVPLCIMRSQSNGNRLYTITTTTHACMHAKLCFFAKKSGVSEFRFFSAFFNLGERQQQ